MKAMIVDDSRVIRKILTQVLSKEGYSLLEASNGEEAFELLNKNPDIGLMLIDWNMPVMNGLELVRKIRADVRFGDIALVMSTTEVEKDNIAMALEAGANEYIMKPFTPMIVIEKLKAMGI